MTKARESSPGRPLSVTTARTRLAADRPSECRSPGLAVVTGCDTTNVREPPFCVAAAVCPDAVSFAPNRSICAYQESLLLDTWLRRSRRRPTL